MTSVPSSAPRLRVSDRMGRRVVQIDKSPFTIGRSNQSDLRVFSSEVSREHAEIVAGGDRFLLRDCASRYGTFVNGQIQTEHVLVDGDRIRLGRNASVEIIFLNQPDDTATGASLVGVVRQTGALLEGLRALGAAHLLQDVLILVLDAAIDVSGADRGFIMLANPDGTLDFTLARSRGHIALAGPTFKTSRKIPREVFDTGESRIVRDLARQSVSPLARCPVDRCRHPAGSLCAAAASAPHGLVVPAGAVVSGRLAFIECLVRGHDDSMRRSPGRLFLQCERCGRETPGWTIVSSPRTLRAPRPAAPIPRLVERRAGVASNHNNDRQNAA